MFLVPTSLITGITKWNCLTLSNRDWNLRGNQLLNGSSRLKPLYPGLTTVLQVKTAVGLHQSSLWLRPAQTQFCVFKLSHLYSTLQNWVRRDGAARMWWRYSSAVLVQEEKRYYYQILNLMKWRKEWQFCIGQKFSLSLSAWISIVWVCLKLHVLQKLQLQQLTVNFTYFSHHFWKWNFVKSQWSAYHLHPFTQDTCLPATKSSHKKLHSQSYPIMQLHRVTKHQCS